MKKYNIDTITPEEIDTLVKKEFTPKVKREFKQLERGFKEENFKDLFEEDLSEVFN